MSGHSHHHADHSGGTVTGPLREEHRELLPSIDALAAAADAIGFAAADEQRRGVDSAYDFLAEELIPHAQAEDRVLYAEVDRLLGGSGETRPTDTMRRDHAEVAKLTERLGELRAELRRGELDAGSERELRGVLYGLHTLVTVHFAKEEEVYLPLLDRELTPDRADALFSEMAEVKSVSSGPGQAPTGSPSTAEERQ